MGRRPHHCAHDRSCEAVDLASLTWISYAEQLYTDTAFMLDASMHVAAAAVGRRKLPRRSALPLRRRHIQMGR